MPAACCLLHVPHRLHAACLYKNIVGAAAPECSKVVHDVMHRASHVAGPKGEGGLDDATGAGGGGGASMKQSSGAIHLGEGLQARSILPSAESACALAIGAKHPIVCIPSCSSR